MTGTAEEPAAPGPAGVPVSIARRQLAELVQRAVYLGEITCLTRHGRRVAAIVPIALIEACQGRQP